MAKFTSAFIEIKNFGVFEKDDHDSWKAGNYKVRNGYLGVRSIDTDDGRHLIFCEIFKTEFGYPKYKCTVYDKDNVSDGKEIKTVEEFSISGVVKSLIKELGLFTKKSWPGTNFYGLTTSGYNKR